MKAEATLHLTAPLTYVLALLSVLLALPAAVSARGPLLAAYAAAMVGATAVVLLYHGAAERARDPSIPLGRIAVRVTALLLVGVGIAPLVVRAVAEGLLGVESPFVRTPKYGTAPRRPYVLPLDPTAAAEAAFLAYGLVLLGAVGAAGAWPLLPWACLFAAAPTKRSPDFANATTDGVVLIPSLLSITLGSPPSMMATQENVVPKSMPIIFDLSFAISHPPNPVLSVSQQ